MSSIGDVVLIKNLVFKTTAGQKHCTIDHSFIKGRPCVIISETDDDIYFISMHSANGDIRENEFPLHNKYTKKETYVNLRDIYKRPNFSYQTVTRLDCLELLKLLVAFYKYQLKYKDDDFFEEVENSVIRQLKILSNLDVQNKGLINRKIM